MEGLRYGTGWLSTLPLHVRPSVYRERRRFVGGGFGLLAARLNTLPDQAATGLPIGLLPGHRVNLR